MVAITTDSARFDQLSSEGPAAPVLRLAPSGPADAWSSLARLLLVLAAAAVVVAVAVASAAFGRLIDSHRGIPELGATAEVSVQAPS